MSLVKTFCQSAIQVQFYRAHPSLPEWMKPLADSYQLVEKDLYPRTSGPDSSDVIDVFQANIDERAVIQSMIEIDEEGAFAVGNMFGAVELRSFHFMKLVGHFYIDIWNLRLSRVRFQDAETLYTSLQLCGRNVLEHRSYEISFPEDVQNNALYQRLVKLQSVFFFLMAQKRGEIGYGDYVYRLNDLPENVVCKILKYMMV